MIRKHHTKQAYSSKRFLLLTFALLLSCMSLSQTKVAPNVSKDLAFGDFVAGTGGQITFNPNGTRTVTSGNIILVGGSSYIPLTITWQAPTGGSRTIYGISLNSPSVFVQLEGSTISLTGPNGGSMSFQFGQPIINGTLRSFGAGISVSNKSNNTFIYGGILTVGSSPPIGTYNASFNLTLFYQ